MHDLAATPVVTDVRRERVPASESLVVLTRDPTLAATLKVLGSEHDIVTVDAESDLAGELLARPTGVAIIDAAASTQVERLTQRLRSQFPDLVLIVAGRLDDQSTLAAQITSGAVYRFLHKPVSEQRVKLFVEAAWRRHGEKLSGVADAMATRGPQSDERAPVPRNGLLVGGMIMATLALAGGWFLTRTPAVAPASTLHTAAAPVAAPRDEQLEILLARAETAFAAGALVAPPAENAADLYKQALLHNGSEPRAAAGIEKVVDQLLSAAEVQLAAHHFDEAHKLTDRARALEPDHVRVAFLAARIGKERERSVSTRARRGAASGNPERSIAVLDDATRETKPTTLVTEARQEPAPAPTNTDAEQAPQAPSEGKQAGGHNATLGAVEHEAAAAQESGRLAAQVVSAGDLELARYVPPRFPLNARERGLSGWVDVQFIVASDGQVSDLIVTGAEPAGVFEQAAGDAIKKWRYKPVQRDGHAVDQRARLRMKFALDK